MLSSQYANNVLKFTDNLKDLHSFQKIVLRKF